MNDFHNKLEHFTTIRNTMFNEYIDIKELKKSTDWQYLNFFEKTKYTIQKHVLAISINMINIYIDILNSQINK